MGIEKVHSKRGKGKGVSLFLLNWTYCTVTDPCRTVLCRYHYWGMPGRQAGSPIAVYVGVHNAKSPKQGRKRFNSIVKTIHFSYLPIIYLWGKGREKKGGGGPLNSLGPTLRAVKMLNIYCILYRYIFVKHRGMGWSSKRKVWLTTSGTAFVIPFAMCDSVQINSNTTIAFLINMLFFLFERTLQLFILFIFWINSTKLLFWKESCSKFAKLATLFIPTTCLAKKNRKLCFCFLWTGSSCYLFQRFVS